MFKQTANSRALWRSLAVACAIAGSAAVTSAAFAGECPADKVKANAREKVDYKAVGVTDVTLGSIDLEKEPANIKGRELEIPQADDRTRGHRALGTAMTTARH